MQDYEAQTTNPRAAHTAEARRPLPGAAEALQRKEYTGQEKFPQLQLRVLQAASDDGVRLVLCLLPAHQVEGKAEDPRRHLDRDGRVDRMESHAACKCSPVFCTAELTLDRISFATLRTRELSSG